MFRVVPGTLLGVRHRVTGLPIIGTRNKGVGPRRPESSVSDSDCAPPLWGLSEIKSRDHKRSVSVLGDKPGQRMHAIRGCMSAASRDSQMALGFKRKSGTPAPRQGRHHCLVGQLEVAPAGSASPQTSSTSGLSWVMGRNRFAQGRRQGSEQALGSGSLDPGA